VLSSTSGAGDRRPDPLHILRLDQAPDNPPMLPPKGLWRKTMEFVDAVGPDHAIVRKIPIPQTDLRRHLMPADDASSIVGAPTGLAVRLWSRFEAACALSCATSVSGSMIRRSFELQSLGSGGDCGAKVVQRTLSLHSGLSSFPCSPSMLKVTTARLFANFGPMCSPHWDLRLEAVVCHILPTCYSARARSGVYIIHEVNGWEGRGARGTRLKSNRPIPEVCLP
jgi:hypothetical protein